VVDSATAVHFTLSSSGVASGATALVSGSGDLVRPDKLVGSLLVSEDGVSATVKVVELGGRFYVQLPFTAHYSRTNPHTYGLGDPAQLLSPTVGVSSLLTAMRAPKLEGSIRIDGELLDVIAGTVPGTKVPVLSDLDPSQAVTITADIAPGSYQLRRVELTGPFTKARSITTYDVTITDYDEHVTVRAPQT
jgi:lipoprotein LprG